MIENDLYLLDTSYAKFARNVLSELNPHMLFTLEILNKYESFIIEVCQIGIEEYRLIIDEYESSSVEYATVHLQAKEIAQEAIRNAIDLKLRSIALG